MLCQMRRCSLLARYRGLADAAFGRGHSDDALGLLQPGAPLVPAGKTSIVGLVQSNHHIHIRTYLDIYISIYLSIFI